MAIVALVLVLLMVVIGIAMYRRRRYVFFRLVDGRTSSPITGARVYGLRYSASHASVTTVSAGLAFVPTGDVHETRDLVGELDTSGQFQRWFGHGEYAALWIEAPGVTGGMIGIDAVADYDRFPAEPYVCTVASGMIAPPRRRSNIIGGLGPGEAPTRREGYTNRYERPQPHETVICHATLDEAKRHAYGGGLDRYWKVEGIFVTDGASGFQLEVEHVERAS